MSFAIYSRLSRQDNESAKEVGSCEVQRTRALEFARRQGWTGEPLVLDDDGVSGAVIERPGLTALLDAARAGRIRRVVVRDLDRLARDQVFSAWTLAELERARVEVWSYGEGKRIGLRGHEGILTALTSFVAETERQKAITRTRDALRRRAQLGRSTGAAPIGYRNARRPDPEDPTGKKGIAELQIDPEGKAIVLDLARRYVRAEGNQSQVAREMNKAGVRTPHGRFWTVERVVRTLRNPLYRGLKVHGRRGAIIEAGRKRRVKNPEDQIVRTEVPHLRILPVELAAQVDRLLATPRPRRWGGAAEAKHLGALFIACARCGSSVCATAGRYKCRGQHQSGREACVGISTRPIEAVDAEIIRMVLPLLDPARIMAEVRRQLASSGDAREANRASVRRALQSAEKRVDALAEAIAQGSPPAALLAKLRAEEAKVEEHRSALAQLDGPAPTRLDARRQEQAIRERLEKLYSAAKEGGMAARRAIEAILGGKRLVATPVIEGGRQRWQLRAEVRGGYLLASNDHAPARPGRATGASRSRWS